MNNVTTVKAQVIREQNLTGTTYTPQRPLDLGTHRAWLRSRNAAGEFTVWSPVVTFRVANVPVVASPAGNTFERRPTISWSQVNGAVSYDLWVNNVTTRQSQIIRDQSLTASSYAPQVDLADGLHRVWVRAFDAAGGTDGWSSTLDFQIGGAPTLTAPVGLVGRNPPQFTWTAVTGSARYDLWVNNVSTGQGQVIRETSLTGVSFTHATPLAAGTYRAWIRAIIADGRTSLWSAPIDFVIVAATPDSRNADDPDDSDHDKQQVALNASHPIPSWPPA